MSIDINMLTNMLLALRDNKNLSFYCEKRSGNIVKIRNKNRCRYKRICIRANLIYIFFSSLSQYETKYENHNQIHISIRDLNLICFHV